MMEHRHFPRKPVDMIVQLLNTEGISSQTRVLDISAEGMRLVVKGKGPKVNEVVEVVLTDVGSTLHSTQHLRMFVIRKQASQVGLWLFDENTRRDNNIPGCGSHDQHYPDIDEEKEALLRFLQG